MHSAEFDILIEILKSLSTLEPKNMYIVTNDNKVPYESSYTIISPRVRGVAWPPNGLATQFVNYFKMILY